MLTATQVSEHFSLEALTISETAARLGISNVVPLNLMPNLERTAAFLERVRVYLNHDPVDVHSCYRAPAVNKLVGGVPTSAHCRALAGDILCPSFGVIYAVACKIRDTPELMAKLDQLILEYGWVHVGLADDGKEPRHQLLTKRSAASPYEVGILNGAKHEPS